MSPMSPRLLRPLKSLHPEAADWAARVTAAGATYSGTTLTAVSKFCRSIDAAGIRSKLLRVNLFCGNSITAALIPLYRSSAYGGAVVGNATDTNNNFVGADYTESNGIAGNGSTKYLATGLPMTFAGTNQMHMFCSFAPNAASFATVLVGSRLNTTGSFTMESIYSPGSSLNRPRQSWFGSGGQPANHCSPITGRTQYLCNFDGTQPLLILGRNVDLANTVNAGTYSSANTTPFYIFAGFDPTKAAGQEISGFTAHTIDAYSLGTAFSSAAQRTAFHNAMADFRSAIGRI